MTPFISRQKKIKRKKMENKMKTNNANELNEKFMNCPSQRNEYEIDGKKYVVVSHFTGQKNLENVVYRNAFQQAFNDVIQIFSRTLTNKKCG